MDKENFEFLKKELLEHLKKKSKERMFVDIDGITSLKEFSDYAKKISPTDFLELSKIIQEELEFVLQQDFPKKKE